MKEMHTKSLSRFLNEAKNLNKIEEEFEKLKWEERIIIYGAGNTGIFLSKLLLKNNIKTSFFMDINAISIKSCESINVVLPSKDGLSKKQRKNSLIILAIGDPELHIPITRELKKNGFERIIYFHDIYGHYIAEEYEYTIFKKNFQKILKCSMLWEDEYSYQVYLNRLLCLVSNHNFDNNKLLQLDNQYFVKDIGLSKEDYESFCDFGAYNGDTVRKLNEVYGKVKDLVLFEPDSCNFNKLVSYLSLEKEKLAERILVYPCGAWSDTRVLNFDSDKNYGCKVADTGSCIIQGISLDDILYNIRPSFIKMDIEGAELEALIGAKNIIMKFRPNLAISVYHTVSHHWELMILLDSWGLGYKFYLRTHNYYGYDTVLYAINH